MCLSAAVCLLWMCLSIPPSFALQFSGGDSDFSNHPWAHDAFYVEVSYIVCCSVYLALPRTYHRCVRGVQLSCAQIAQYWYKHTPQRIGERYCFSSISITHYRESFMTRIGAPFVLEYFIVERDSTLWMLMHVWVLFIDSCEEGQYPKPFVLRWDCCTRIRYGEVYL